MDLPREQGGIRLPGKRAVGGNRVVREDGEHLDGDFGEIPPLGAREVSVVDMFGSRVFDFLKPFGGRGTTVTTCNGVTLAHCGSLTI